MTPHYGYLGIVLTGLTILGCAHPTLPPALPDDRIVLQQGFVNEAPGFATPDQLLPRLSLETLAVRVPQPTIAVGVVPVLPEKQSSRKRARETGERPEQVIDAANRDATVGPTKSGYQGTAVMRYAYSDDHIYEVYSSPLASTFIRLPSGQRFADPPVLNDAEWDASKIEMGTEDAHQEGLRLRPKKAGLSTYTTLITTEGFAIKCHLRSFEKTSMLEVAWAIPQALLPAPPALAPVHESPRERSSVTLVSAQTPSVAAMGHKLKSPSLNAERLHTGYRIDVKGKTTPPWVPTGVIDDGTKTLIQFKEPLTFTSAPVVFAVHEDLTPAPVEFTPYTSERGDKFMYIVVGLYPQLTLKGANKMEVTITRLSSGY